MKYVVGFLAIIFAAVMTHGEWQAVQNDVPAFHPAPPVKGTILPAVLTEAQLAQAGLTYPAQKASYKAAARIGAVLYQQPCYCHCDRGHGHTSLRSCFESTHGANCGVCMGEALYSYKMSKQGWTPKMIRDGIIRGDWKLIDQQHPDPVN